MVEKANEHAIASLRHTVAVACRVMAHAGLADSVLGHVSVRVDAERMLLRCRGPQERGLLFTDPDDIRLVGLDGRIADDGPTTHSVPHEFHIHAEVLRARPEIAAVVHAHPRRVVVADLAGIELRPIVGAFNIPAHLLGRRGVPVYPRSVLVRTPELGREVVAALGTGGHCILRGHGIVTAGASVEQALVRALDLDDLAALSAEVAALGGSPRPVPPSDQAELPDLGSELNDLSMWRHRLAKLAADGLALG